MTAANIKKYAATGNGGKLFEQSTSTAAAAAATNVSNGGASSDPPTKRGRSASENVWTVWINTIYDVIVFLGASVGFILQVRD